MRNIFLFPPDNLMNNQFYTISSSYIIKKVMRFKCAFILLFTFSLLSAQEVTLEFNPGLSQEVSHGLKMEMNFYKEGPPVFRKPGIARGNSIDHFTSLAKNQLYGIAGNGIYTLDRFWNTPELILEILDTDKKTFAIAADGQIYLADDGTRTIQIMDAMTAETQIIANYTNELNRVNSMAFARSGKLVLTAVSGIYELDLTDPTLTRKVTTKVQGDNGGGAWPGDLAMNLKTNKFYYSSLGWNSSGSHSTRIVEYDADSYLEQGEVYFFRGKQFSDIFLDQNGEIHGINLGEVYHLNRETLSYVKVGNSTFLQQVIGFLDDFSHKSSVSPSALDLGTVKLGNEKSINLVVSSNAANLQLLSIDLAGTLGEIDLSDDLSLPLDLTSGVSQPIELSFVPNQKGVSQMLLNLSFTDGTSTWNKEVQLMVRGFGFTPIRKNEFYGLRTDSKRLPFLDKLNFQSGEKISSVRIESVFEAMAVNSKGEMYGMKGGVLFQVDQESGGTIEVDRIWTDNSSGRAVKDLSMTFDNYENLILCNLNHPVLPEETPAYIRYLNYDLINGSLGGPLPLYGRNISFDPSSFTFYAEHENTLYLHDLKTPINLEVGKLDVGDLDAEGLFFNEDSELFGLLSGEDKSYIARIDKLSGDILSQVELDSVYLAVVTSVGETRGELVVTSVEEPLWLSSLLIYPNPIESTGTLVIEGIDQSVSRVSMVNPYGRNVSNINTNGSSRIDWNFGKTNSEGLKKGFYIIAFYSASDQLLATRKIVVNH